MPRQPQKRIGQPAISTTQGILLFRERILKADSLLQGWVGPNELESWINTTRSCVEKAFGANHRNVDDFLQRVDATVNTSWNNQQWNKYRANVLQAKVAALEGYIEELETEETIQSPVGTNLADIFIGNQPLVATTDRAQAAKDYSNKIFIVHGHTGELKEATDTTGKAPRPRSSYSPRTSKEGSDHHREPINSCRQVRLFHSPAHSG